MTRGQPHERSRREEQRRSEGSKARKEEGIIIISRPLGGKEK